MSFSYRHVTLDEKGLGVLLNRDDDGGLVLFNLSSFWKNDNFARQFAVSLTKEA